jgi:hypothetical protein
MLRAYSGFNRTIIFFYGQLRIYESFIKTATYQSYKMVIGRSVGPIEISTLFYKLAKADIDLP